MSFCYICFMFFSDILGHESIKTHLLQTIENKRVAHAQLFVGKEGNGALMTAIAYAKEILCSESLNAEACQLKTEKLQHPDLHFSFPITTTKKHSKDPKCDYFIEQWREFILNNPYGTLYEWLQFMDSENKQGIINVAEAKSITEKLLLKSYEGGYKICVIWMAEKMNTDSGNRLLKLIEEPPEKTIFLLVTEDKDSILKTILSRCQIIEFPPLSEADVSRGLIEQFNISESDARKIAIQADGNFNKAMHIYKNDDNNAIFEGWFITWIRAAFKAKGNASVINDLIEWSNEIASNNRETQKQFLDFCLLFFRQALLFNYNAKELVFLETKTPGFKLSKFAPFVHGNNIINIDQEINDAIYHIERNGNAKIILLDLSIKLTRLLHTKE